MATRADPAGLDTPPPPFTVGSLVRQTPALVWALTALHVLVLVGYSVVVPTYRAPDEALHVDLVLMVRDQLAGHESFGWPPETQRHIADRVDASLRYLRIPEGPRRQTVGQARLRGDRPSFDELGSAEERTELTRNQLVQHPPTYYAIAAVWLALPPRSHDWSFDRQVAHLRLLSVVLLMPLPLLLYATGMLLSHRRPVALAAAIAALGVPQFTYMGAVVNNDSLLVAAGAVLTVPLLHAARGDLSARTAAWAGAALGAALAAKGLALAIVPWVGLAYLLGWRRHGGRLPWRCALVTSAVAMLTGGWWWLRRLLTVGAVHVRGTVYTSDPTFTPDPAGWVSDAFVPAMLESWWASFVWTGPVLPYPLVLVPAAVLVVGIVAALSARGPARVSRADCALLLLPSLLLLALTAWASYTTYARTGQPVGIQGRYLYSGFSGLVASVAFGYATLMGRHERLLPISLYAAAAALQGLAVWHMLAHYWDLDVAGLVPSVLGVMAWSPWPQWLLAALGSLTAVLTTMVALGAVHQTRRDARQEQSSELD